MLVAAAHTVKRSAALVKHTTMSVNYVNLHVDSPFIDAITDSDLTANDILRYDKYASNGGEISIDSDGLVTILGATTAAHFYCRVLDSSNGLAATQRFKITIEP